MKTYDLQDILTIAKSIKSKAEAMTSEELDAMACGDGFLTFVDEEPELCEYLDTLPDEDQVMITDMIMQQVFSVYESKAEQPITDNKYLLLGRLNNAAEQLTEEQLFVIVDLFETYANAQNKEDLN